MRIYEINTRAHLGRFDQLDSAELAQLAELGFDAIWLMGVWQISEGALKLSQVVSKDFAGSPFAVPEYSFSESLGGHIAFSALVEKAHTAGLSVIVDFVSNHMAIDSPWISEHPDFFMKSDPEMRPQSTSQFFLHPSGEVIAFGSDPYFPPWTDTSQLDYTSAGLRRRMIEVLRFISSVADGVRCDMAMLVLRDQIRRQWYPLASDRWFNERMPYEFWRGAITETKEANREFVFVAEAYWDKERELLDLGFDLAYEKKLYDGLVARDSKSVLERLSRPLDDLRGSVHFIENHDEPRAAACFNRNENIAALGLILTLPGSVLIHEGQMEGKRERLPVQRLKPTVQESTDEALRAGYLRLLHLTNADVFRDGAFTLLDAPLGTIAFIRQTPQRAVCYIGQIGVAPGFPDTIVRLPAPLSDGSPSDELRIVNLVNSHSILVTASHGCYQFVPAQLAVGAEERFCLLELFSASDT